MDNINIKGSNENVSSSSYSHSGTGQGQLRYKKALKEISKLVTINTSLKRELETSQQQCHRLEIQYEKISMKYTQLLMKMENSHLPLSISNSQRQKDIEKSFSEVQTSLELPTAMQTQSQQMNDARDRMMQQYKNEIKFLQDSIMELEGKFNQKEESVRRLEGAVASKHAEIIQLEGRVGELGEEVEKIGRDRDGLIQRLSQLEQEREKDKEREKEKKVAEQKENNNPSPPASSDELQKQRTKVRQLQHKLKTLQDWSLKLQQEYAQLRKYTFFSQNSIASSQSSSSLKMPNIVRLTSTETQTSNFYKKYQMGGQTVVSPNTGLTMKLEEELARVKKEYRDKKMRYKEEIFKAKEENLLLNQRITSMLGLIHKQQEYIENFVENQGKV